MTRYEQLQKKIEDVRNAERQAQDLSMKEIWEVIAIKLELRRDFLTVEEAEVEV